jgi:hypothetical protein
MELGGKSPIIVFEDVDLDKGRRILVFFFFLLCRFIFFFFFLSTTICYRIFASKVYHKGKQVYDYAGVALNSSLLFYLLSSSG